LKRPLPSPPRAERDRLLVVLPRLPSRGDAAAKLLAELRPERELDVLCAAPSPAEEAALRALGASAAPESAALPARCRALERGRYAAAVVVDDASTRGCVDELKRALAAPVALAVFTPRPTASLRGDGFAARRREREDAVRRCASADEIWAFDVKPPERAWLDRRLRELGEPAAAARELASVIIPASAKSATRANAWPR